MTLQQKARITRDLFIQGKEVEEIMAHFADLGYKRTYLECLSSIKKGKLSVAGRVNRERPWSEDEDQMLRDRLKAGCNIEQLRKILFRNTFGVRDRMAFLDLATKDGEKKPECYTPARVASMPWGEPPVRKQQEESRR